LKLELIVKLLRLRLKRPEAFAGDYQALDAGPTGCAFIRGDSVLTIVKLPRAASDGGSAALHDAPGGQWRNVITGAERSFSAAEPLADLVGSYGFAVYERT
jgi:hypothetical protein